MEFTFYEQRALCLAAIFCGLSSVVLANDVTDRAEGDWGFERFTDMTCANNPARLRFVDDGLRAEFTWPKSVAFNDGIGSNAVTYTVISTEGNRINFRRDRDGETGYLILSADGMSYRSGLDS